MLINDHRPCRQIYDHGGYKETWDNAASHLYSYKWHSRVSLGFVSGHGGGGDDDGDDEEEMEKYEEAGIRWRRAASEPVMQEVVVMMLLDG